MSNHASPTQFLTTHTEYGQHKNACELPERCAVSKKCNLKIRYAHVNISFHSNSQNSKPLYLDT
jgi:hypothetical protein